MVKSEIIRTLKKYRKTLTADGIPVLKMVLYGSQANGHCHKDSDIDVAVISQEFGKDRFEEGVRLFKLAYKIDPRIEPVPLSLKAYEKDTWVPLIYEIRTKGVAIKA
ncbi:nucleotidyltransferase domain-containing protein [candidate division TA06 bacterium]|uniref:Nucleotidyltransferase domain-containing protein n=1 Tax=candidate division TA06 bacterium TaxID=2250710 RepID=A0A933IBC5_UNCT6|nr:nucleotidyltransferase domain-containing protein [candidate division TA06 bacterium]